LTHNTFLYLFELSLHIIKILIVYHMSYKSFSQCFLWFCYEMEYSFTCLSLYYTSSGKIL
jgi:hypothetical protein